MNLRALSSLPELRRDLARVDEALFTSVSTSDRFLEEVASHLIRAGGKRLRPALTLAAAKTAGNDLSDDVIRGAVAVELVHLGSLYHDDVLDEAEQRRGVPSVNAAYGNAAAVLAGDFLLARASSIAADLGAPIASLLAKAIAELCTGQIAEIQDNFNLDRTLADYERSISGKTASLLEAAARMGAMTSEFSPDHTDALGDFGHAFGMGFQIRDDILDITATDEELGKPSGNDLIEGVYNLPVLYALEEPEAGPQLRDLLGGPIDTDTRDQARTIVRETDGPRRAKEEGQRRAWQAGDALTKLPKSSIRTLLEELSVKLFD